MKAVDPHRFSRELDDNTTNRLVDRLESRAKDRVFTALFDEYVAELDLPSLGHVLEVGCGTGAVARALAGREGFSGRVVGVDQSAAFIAAARRFAGDETPGQPVEFVVGDAHELAFDAGSFDLVIVHTVMSHVENPRKVLEEAARVVCAGGYVAIFDGDYASLTFAFRDSELGRRMDHALAVATFNNPLIMRDLVRLLPEMGLERSATFANVVSEIGTASFFKTFAETYAPMVVRAGLLSQDDVDHWLAEQIAAMESGTFFASCNYYAYLARRK